ncbi:MAG: PAS domain S-box protein [Candidatus Coatesbacteria bacterium]|nr:MAG: PAS domain S-box protein [Candidatus Coatesbacteria bacterium]
MADEQHTPAELRREVERLRRRLREYEAAGGGGDEALRGSEERLRSLQENIPVGIFRSTADPEGRIVSANSALARMFGYDAPDDMAEVKVASLYAEAADRKAFLAALSAHGVLSDYEARFKRSDGAAFWGALSARAVRDAQGRVAYIDGVVEDISDRKRAEEERDLLRRRAEVAARDFEAILNNVDVLLWSVRADEQGDLWYEQVNHAFAAVEGKTPEYYNGKRIADIATAEQLEAIRRRFEALRVGETCTYETKHREGMSERHFIVRLIPVGDAAGKVRRFIGAATDITEPKYAEEELKRHIRTLEGLSEISRVVDQAAGIEEAVGSAVVFLADNPSVVAGAIYLYDANGKRLELHQTFGRPGSTFERKPSLDTADANVRLILTSPAAVFVDEWLLERGASETGGEAAGEEGHVVAAPLRAEGEALGIFAMVLRHADIHTLAFVEMIGAELGSAIQRKRAEKALRDNEETSRVLLNAPGNVAFLLDPEGRIVNFNEPARARVGLEEGELRGRNLWEVLPATLVERRRAYVEEVVGTGRPVHFEESRPRVAYENYYYPVAAAGGAAHVVVFSWRLDERPALEAALGETGENFAARVETSPLAGLEVDAGGAITYANAAAAKLFGFREADALRGSSLATIVAAADDGAEGATWRDLLRRPGPSSGEFTACLADGGRVAVWIRASAAPEDNESPATRMVVVDITERKGLEHALHSGVSPTRVLEMTDCPFAFFADSDGAIVATNEATARRVGLSAADLRGRSCFDFFPPGLAEKRTQEFETAVRTGRPVFFVDEFPGAVYENNIYPIRDSSGAVTQLAFFSRDVTAAKRAEEELTRYRHHLEVLVDDRTEELSVANVTLQREVAERKRAEEEIRYISEFTTNLVESTQVGIYALDREARVQIWNKGMESQFGVDSAELIGKTIFEVFPALSSEALGGAIRRALETGETYEQTGLRHRTLRKGDRILNTKINPLTNASGEIEGAVVITEDVTESVQAAEELRKSEERYRGLYHTTLALADETDLAAVLRQIAGQAQALLAGDDCTVYELDGEGGVLEPIYTASPRYREEVMAFRVPLGTGLTGRVAQTGVGQFVNSGTADDVTEHIPGTDHAEDVEESIIAVPMFDAGAVLGVLSVSKTGGMFDEEGLEKLTVFARQAEMAIKRARYLGALRESEERYRSLVEAIHGGFAVVDADEKILFANAGFCDMLGYTKGELEGKNMRELVAPEEVDKLLAQTQRKRASGEPTRYEIVARRRDGVRRDLLISSTPYVDETGRYRYSLGVVLDVTDQKETEAELKIRTQQLEQAHRRVDGLLRNILPAQVIRELETTRTSTPRLVPNVTIVFVDFVGFSDISARINHKALLTKLSAYFHTFDLIIKEYGLEKLKTVGDGYMYAGGLFAESNQADLCAEAALDILKCVGTRDWRVRIGIHVGPCIAGLIKGWRMIYDVWGPTVNVASRLHEASDPGKINTSEVVFRELADRFEFESRGELPLHTLGPTPMYFLLGKKEPEAERS